MGFRMKDFNIMEVHWKTRFLVWFMKNQYMGELPKTEGWGGGGIGKFVDLGGGRSLAKKRWVGLLKGETE